MSAEASAENERDEEEFNNLLVFFLCAYVPLFLLVATDFQNISSFRLQLTAYQRKN